MLLQLELPEKYKTGHEQIDGHHRHLFNIIHTIMNLSEGKEKNDPQEIDKELNQLLNDLQNYAKNHFNFEELVMKKLGYPGIANQKKLHKEFVKRLSDIQMGYSKDHSAINEAVGFLRVWLFEHVDVEDKKIIAYQKMLAKKNNTIT